MADEDGKDEAMARYRKRRAKQDGFIDVRKALRADKGRYYERYAFEQRHRNGLHAIITTKSRGVHVADPELLADWVTEHPKMLPR